MWRASRIASNLWHGLMSASPVECGRGSKEPLGLLRVCGAWFASSWPPPRSLVLMNPFSASVEDSNPSNPKVGRGGERGGGKETESPIFGGAGGCGVHNAGGGGGREENKDYFITFSEARKLMRLVNVEALKNKLGMGGKEVIGYSDLLEACKSMGIARSPDEATAFARILDEAGVVLLFRDKVYLHPDKVVDLVRRAVPFALTPEDDPRRGELKKLQEQKEEIERLAHKQVRRILWSGLGFVLIQVGLFFRLTFWEFSWDVMEPIAFFTTSTGVVIGYAYFMFTSRDPTYQDLLKRLYFSRQRKLFKKHNFDVDKFLELQKKCKCPSDIFVPVKGHLGRDLGLEDTVNRD